MSEKWTFRSRNLVSYEINGSEDWCAGNLLSSKDVELLFDAKPTLGFGALNVNWKLGVVESYAEMYITLLLSRVLKVENVHIKLRQPINLQQGWAPLLAMMDRLSEFRLWSKQYNNYVYVWPKNDNEGIKGMGNSGYDALEQEKERVYQGVCR